MAYWDVLDAKLAPASSLSEKQAMSNLNDARVNLKHSSNMFDRQSLDTHYNTLTRFFDENTKTLFQISFAEISLIELVFPESARADLKEAENALHVNDRGKAAKHIALAFQRIIDDYESKKRDRFGGGPFAFGANIPVFNWRDLIDPSVALHAGSNRGRQVGPILDIGKVTSAFNSIGSAVGHFQAALRIIALGIDFRKYSRFRCLTPFISENLNRQYIMHDLPQDKSDALTGEEMAFCLDFVIETSLLLQESDRPASTSMILPNEVQP
jgi:hypothetical protein